MNLIPSPCDPNWTGCCYDTKRDDTTFGFVFDFSMNALFEPPAVRSEATRWQQSLLINKETAALREHFSRSKNTLSSSFPKLNVCYQAIWPPIYPISALLELSTRHLLCIALKS